MKKPRTRLDGTNTCGDWEISLYVNGTQVANALANRRVYWWPRRGTAKAQAERWAADLGNIPVVVVDA